SPRAGWSPSTASLSPSPTSPDVTPPPRQTWPRPTGCAPGSTSPDHRPRPGGTDARAAGRLSTPDMRGPAGPPRDGARGNALGPPLVYPVHQATAARPPTVAPSR